MFVVSIILDISQTDLLLWVKNVFHIHVILYQLVELFIKFRFFQGIFMFNKGWLNSRRFILIYILALKDSNRAEWKFGRLLRFLVCLSSFHPKNLMLFEGWDATACVEDVCLTHIGPTKGTIEPKPSKFDFMVWPKSMVISENYITSHLTACIWLGKLV